MNNPNQSQPSTVRVRGGFWRQKVDVVAQQMLPYQWKALNDQVPGAEPSHAIENFRIAAGESQGTFVGNIFQDSDVAKWLEAASYALADHPDPVLEGQVDEAIRLIEKAQGPDGYVNTWFTLVGSDKRWTDLAWGHELYCGGHLIEAAVAHFQATGSRRFLAVMARFADGLLPVFGPGGPHEEDACGHPEIELALHRLADATGEGRYRDLAVRFVEARGHHPDRFVDQKPLVEIDIPPRRWAQAEYFLAQAPVRDQHHAEGHAVRAMYLYTAMAKQAKQTGEPTLLATLKDLWTSVVDRRMYVTGGLGSHSGGERFSIDYDLPSDTAYTETCASIGFLFWARAMLEVDPLSRYADEMERALYNGVLSGMALDGKRFFYVNPLEVVPLVARFRQDLCHVKTERIAWFGCSCCPPNIARLVSSVGTYAWACDGSSVRVDQFVDSEARFELESGPVTLEMATKYPWEGLVAVTVRAEAPRRFSLALRVPGWCSSYAVRQAGKTLETLKGPDGYLHIDRVWSDGDSLELELALPVRFLGANPRVPELAGRVAVARGPLMFCAEEVDNGSDLHNLTVDPLAPTTSVWVPELMGGSLKVTLQGRRQSLRPSEALYSAWNPRESGEPVDVVLVPYHQWGNRKPGQEMRVWLRTGRA